MKWLGLGIIFYCSLAGAASFQGQTTFTATIIQGELQITCHDNQGIETRYVICRDQILDPFEMGYFNAEQGLDADEAVVISLRSDGKRVEKKVGYDSTKGQSVKRLNLWIETLLQTALLDIGSNPVSYELRKDGQVRASGNFEVSVGEGERRTCARGYESSFSRQDCQFPQHLCQRYFSRRNWCL